MTPNRTPDCSPTSSIRCTSHQRSSGNHECLRGRRPSHPTAIAGPDADRVAPWRRRPRHGAIILGTCWRDPQGYRSTPAGLRRHAALQGGQFRPSGSQVPALATATSTECHGNFLTHQSVRLRPNANLACSNRLRRRFSRYSSHLYAQARQQRNDSFQAPALPRQYRARRHARLFERTFVV